jgi:hypothetical protein
MMPFADMTFAVTVLDDNRDDLDYDFDTTTPTLA